MWVWEQNLSIGKLPRYKGVFYTHQYCCIWVALSHRNRSPLCGPAWGSNSWAVSKAEFILVYVRFADMWLMMLFMGLPFKCARCNADVVSETALNVKWNICAWYTHLTVISSHTRQCAPCQCAPWKASWNKALLFKAKAWWAFQQRLRQGHIVVNTRQGRNGCKCALGYWYTVAKCTTDVSCPMVQLCPVCSTP